MFFDIFTKTGTLAACMERDMETSRFGALEWIGTIPRQSAAE
jgi:hypothetical protein